MGRRERCFTNVMVFNGTGDRLLDVDVLVEGNPLENILVLQNYKDNIDLIMKEGKVYKNEL